MNSRLSSRLALPLLLAFFAIGCQDASVTRVTAAERPVQAAPDVKLEIFESEDGYGYRAADGGDVVIPARYEQAFEFNEHGVAAVWTGGNWRLIDTAGLELVTVLASDNAPDDFAEGLARYVDGDKIGYIDETATIVISARFDGAWPFENGRAKVCVGCISSPRGEHTHVAGGDWWEIDWEGNKLNDIDHP
jgi:hypothetical protein